MAVNPSPVRVASAYLSKTGTMEVPEAVLKWLQKRATKGKGVVSIPVVEKAFELLDGWSVTDTTTFKLLNGTSSYDNLGEA